MMLNVHELSKELKLSSSGIYQMVGQRKIPFVKIGRSVRFDAEDINKWIAGKKTFSSKGDLNQRTFN
jgi:excisionase family DNA binding protein